MAPTKRTDESTAALRAALIDHGRTLVRRDGADALTMRALALEAGCSTGLAYKVFADRSALVVAIVATELARLSELASGLRARAGTGEVATNLIWLTEQILDSPAVVLAKEIETDVTSSRAVAPPQGVADLFEGSIAGYLAAEKEADRVAPSVDVNAAGFLLGGAVHNLIAAGPAWPRPSRRALRSHIRALTRMLEAS